MSDDDRGAVPSADDLAPGMRVELDIGPVAHGGHCVARYDGRVVFVRLALPGERAVVRITEVRRGSFCRGEAVEVLRADPRRVDAPCVHFRPGGCGGCDFQHADAALQRELKASVLAEQLRRLAGLEVPVTVEELPGGGFGWRTRVRWALDDQGRIGPRAVRSHRVQPINPVEPCLIAAPGLTELAGSLEVPATVRRAPPEPAGTASRSRRRPRRGEVRSSVRAPRRAPRSDLPEVALCASGDGSLTATWIGSQAPVVTEEVAGAPFSVRADGFWQSHRAAPAAYRSAVVGALDGIEMTGGTAWDLYSGVGLFADALGRLVGADGSVTAVESDPAAAELAAGNLAGLPQVEVRTGPADRLLPELPVPVRAVVLDPPRSGAGPDLCRAIAAAAPAAIVYVACDPAAFARDAAALLGAGYRLDGLRAFDAFPQTHHVECVATFLGS